MRAVIDLAEVLGRSVTAEGVETEEQAAALWTLGCERGQGYLFAAPMPIAAMDALLAAPPPAIPVPVGPARVGQATPSGR